MVALQLTIMCKYLKGWRRSGAGKKLGFSGFNVRWTQKCDQEEGLYTKIN